MNIEMMKPNRQILLESSKKTLEEMELLESVEKLLDSPKMQETISKECWILMQDLEDIKTCIPEEFQKTVEEMLAEENQEEKMRTKLIENFYIAFGAPFTGLKFFIDLDTIKEQIRKAIKNEEQRFFDAMKNFAKRCSKEIIDEFYLKASLRYVQTAIPESLRGCREITALSILDSISRIFTSEE